MKKLNYKKIIMIFFAIVFALILGIIIIRSINKSDMDAVRKDIIENEWEISGIYRDENDDVQKCKERMVFLEDGTYFSYIVGVDKKDEIQEKYKYEIKENIFGALKLYCYQDDRAYIGNLVIEDKCEVVDIDVFDAKDEGYKKISAEQITKEEKESAEQIAKKEKVERLLNTIEKELPGSLYVRDVGDTAAFETIKFHNDIIRNEHTLKGHCSYSYCDGSGKVVTFKYYDGIVKANVMEDEHIEKYVTNKSKIATCDYFFYENFMIGERKTDSGLINAEGNFDICIEGCQYNMDGTVRYVGGMYEDGYYSGTYTRDGNIVKVNSYCEATKQNTEWYLYIDKDGAVYQEVYICK